MWRPALSAYLKLIWGSATPSPELLELYKEVLRTPGFTEGFLEAARGIADFRLPVESLKVLPIMKRALWGENDPLVPPWQGEKLALAIGAELKVFDDVGHAVPEERPDLLVAELL